MIMNTSFLKQKIAKNIIDNLPITGTKIKLLPHEKIWVVDALQIQVFSNFYDLSLALKNGNINSPCFFLNLENLDPHTLEKEYQNIPDNFLMLHN